MAQRVHVVLEDDLDGSEAQETVLFGLDGTNYEIDLSQRNATKLRDAMAKYVGASRRKVRSRRRSGRAASGPKPAEVREWAREAGYEVSERGRVPAEIRDAYDAAH
ncbi:MAG: histone-like nucleoid-structuring protein Lsr2 [Nocardioidaceae bacterium]